MERRQVPAVKLYANLRKLAGRKELSVGGDSVRAALTELVKQIPPLGAAILVDGNLGAHVVLILNGRNVTDLDAPVSDDDVLAIFPPIAGG